MSSRKKKPTRKLKANAVQSKRRRRRPGPRPASRPAPAARARSGADRSPTATPTATSTATPTATPTAERQEEEQPQEQQERAALGSAWASENAEATWWAGVWPFADEPTQEEPPEDAQPGPVSVASVPELGDELGDELGHELEDEVDEHEGHEDDEWNDEWDDEWDDEEGDWGDEEGEDEEDPTTAAPSPPLTAVPITSRARSTTPAFAWFADSRWTWWQAALLVVAAVVVGVVDWQVVRPGGNESAVLVRSDTYRAPVRVPPDTSFVRTRVLPSGEMTVTHWIHSSRPLLDVTLRTPPMPGLRPRAVEVSHVVVASDGVSTAGTRSSGPGGARTIQLPPTHRLYLQYHLAGVVETSGGPDHRALARITSLDVETAGATTSSTRTVVGAQVLSLACSPLGSGRPPTPCGKDDQGTWSVTLRAGEQHSQVMAQLNLP